MVLNHGIKKMLTIAKLSSLHEYKIVRKFEYSNLSFQKIKGEKLDRLRRCTKALVKIQHTFMIKPNQNIYVSKVNSKKHLYF